MSGQSWFASWFDTTWYHLLYQNRSQEEASAFIHQLLKDLNPVPNATALDLACGKGRHSITLHQAGLDVTGIDLSPASIAEASQSTTDGLQFLVHDMRVPLIRQFDYVFNLFTSLGYFDTPDEDVAVLKSIATMLKPQGTLVIDFMNAEKVISNLVREETQLRGDVRFNIRRTVTTDEIIVKSIEVQTASENHNFQERVRAYKLSDFEWMLRACNLKIVSLYGDYALSPFQITGSDRLIMVIKHA